MSESVQEHEESGVGESREHDDDGTSDHDAERGDHATMGKQYARFGAMIATSSRPSSGSASGNNAMPPCRPPTLATSTVRTRRRMAGPSSMEMSTRIGRSSRCFTADST